MVSRLSRKLAASLAAAVTVLALVGGGLVLAQDTPAPDAGAPAAAPPPEAEVEETPAEVDVPMRKKAQISPRDMQSQGATYFAKMREVLKRIEEIQDVARKNKDVIKLNCVNDKLLQIKQLVNIGEANKTNLEEAIARDDESGRYDFYANITIANDQVQTLGAEAEQCIGQDLSFLGPTETTTEGGDEPDDPTIGEEPDFPVVEPVPVSSPFI